MLGFNSGNLSHTVNINESHPNQLIHPSLSTTARTIIRASKAESPSDLIFRDLSVCTDIVVASLVGSVREHLRIVKLDERNSVSKLNSQYIPIQSAILRDTTIELRGQNGDFIRIDTESVFVILY